jgi:hypothetical protein
MLQDALDWLMDNSGPVIKYRTSRELLDEPDSRLEKELLECNLVNFWLTNLLPRFGPTELHSSKPNAFENSMGRLYEFGLRKGHEPFDNKTGPALKYLENLALSKGGKPNRSWFSYSILAGYLAMTGYSEHPEVHYIINKRLDSVYEFATEWDLNNTYIDPKTVGNIPKNFRNRPIINPNLWGTRERYENGSLLPTIHDIHGFLHSEPIQKDKGTRHKVEEIMDFILSPEYQCLEPGYGVIYEPHSRGFFSAGWSLHLWKYFDVHPREDQLKKNIGVDKANLLRLSLFRRSLTAKKHRWFGKKLGEFESYKTDGLYMFPRKLLVDRKTGYWVAGRSLGLEENRRTNQAITAESTFRMLEIKRA